MTVPRLRSHPNGARTTIPTSVFLLGLLVSNLLSFRFGLSGGSDSEKTGADSALSSDVVPPAKVSSTSSISYDLARQHSYGFFQDIPNDDWRTFYQELTLARSGKHHYVNHTHPNDRSDNPAWWIFQNWDPVFNCPHLKKVGGLGDGPKFTCDPERIRTGDRQHVSVSGHHGSTSQTSVVLSQLLSTESNSCLIYSIGSNGNYRFEDGLYEILGSRCEIHIFDPGNYDNPGLKEKNMHYHQWGLTSSYSDEYRARARAGNGEYFSFPEIRRRLGHEQRKIDIFKIDCEGCEWHTYKDWISADVQQILIETHDLPLAHKAKETGQGVFPKMNASAFFDAFEENGFVLYSKEVNSAWGKGICAEWSYLKLHPDFFRPPT